MSPGTFSSIVTMASNAYMRLEEQKRLEKYEIMMYRSPWDKLVHWLKFKHRTTLPYVEPQERAELYLWLCENVGKNNKNWISFANYMDRGIDAWRVQSTTYCFRTKQDLTLFILRWM